MNALTTVFKEISLNHADVISAYLDFQAAHSNGDHIECADYFIETIIAICERQAMARALAVECSSARPD